MSALERRVAPRFNRVLPVILHGEKDVRASTESVSRHGIFVASSVILSPTSLLRLTVELPAGEVLRPDRISVTTTVAWTLEPSVANQRGRQPGMGLRFYLIGARDKDLWDAYVDQLEEDPRLSSLEPIELPQLPTQAGEPWRILLKAHTQEALEHFIWGHLHEEGVLVRAPLSGPLEQRIDLVIIHPQTDRECLVPGFISQVRGSGAPIDQGILVEVIEPLPVLHQRLLTFSITGQASVPLWDV